MSRLTHQRNWINTVLGTALLGTAAIPIATQAAPTVQVAPVQNEAIATRNLINRLNGIKSMQAAFTQTTRATGRTRTVTQPGAFKPLSMSGQTVSGVMQVKRPGLFRWETRGPMQQLIVANGRTVWLYDPDLQQATRHSLSEQVANTPALLLSGNLQQITQSYRITQPQVNQDYYVLYPRKQRGADDALFESLALRFGGGVPSQMVLTDTLGQQTTINFSQARLNPTLNNGLFNFVPPKGVDVIDDQS